MTAAIRAKLVRLRGAARRGLLGPQALAFLPALALAAFWLGGEAMLIATALGLPLVYLVAGGRPGAEAREGESPQPDQVNAATAGRLAQTFRQRTRRRDHRTHGAADASDRSGLDDARRAAVGRFHRSCSRTCRRSRPPTRSGRRRRCTGRGTRR